MALMQRKDAETRYTWNFTDLFASDKTWEEEYDRTDRLVESISDIAGTLGDSADAMKSGLDKIYTASQKTELLYVYSMFCLNVDNGDPTYQAMNGRAMNLFVKLSTALSFLEPEILEIPEEQLEQIMATPSMATYRHMLEDTVRGRAHVGSAEVEHLMAMLSDVSGTSQKSFTALESVDMTFPCIQDEKGEQITLTHGNFGVYRESTDARVRKEAFDTYFGEFKKYINTLASMYTGSVKMDNFYTRARKFESSCERALFANRVPVSVYDKLIEAVHGGLPTMRRYLDLRRRILGLEELHMYDLYCPIVKDVEMKVGFEEAKELVKRALRPLGEGYQALLDRAFGERWIDVYENKGKTTGAYSCGVYGVHPYVLLNYTDTLDDVFTLAHELGHAMHSYYSSEAQDFVNHDYRILVAEVASTVNEVLLTRYLLSTETDPARRAYILNHFLEGFRTTVFRQTLFAEFEREAHDLDMNGTPLTAEALNGIYRRLNEQYYSGAVIDELQDIEWARIPHFYNAFYVYQYATGFSSAVSIAKKILEENGAESYLKFLSTGGSDYPLEELKITGIDLTHPDAVAAAMDEFDRALTELEELLG